MHKDFVLRFRHSTRINVYSKRKLTSVLALSALGLLLFAVFYEPEYTFMPPVPLNPSPPHSFTVLTANVGNLSYGCRHVLHKLCYKEVEQRLAENIQSLHPHVITLQEVLAPWQCAELQERDTQKVCSDEQVVSQARRLVGEDYTIACNTTNQFECIAVRTDFGKIDGCALGELCFTARTSQPLSQCDNGFNVSAATVRLHTGLVFDVANAHPQSTSHGCRAQMLSAFFKDIDGQPPLLQENLVLMMGDFNVDPWRDRDISAQTWNRWIDDGWGGRSFIYHSGKVEYNPPRYTTALPGFRKTVDYVLSNFALGICSVLGETPGTSRLDGGAGTDHRAVYGVLTLQPDLVSFLP
jgi:hypothetical protein